MQRQSAQFKQDLVNLRSDFMNYLKQHKTKSIPIKQLVIFLQKYTLIRPTNLQQLISRCLTKQQITWQHVLTYMQHQISLEDQVNKMTLSKPSIIDINFYSTIGYCDEHLGQNLVDIVQHIKKKSTNYIKFIKRTQFLSFRLLVVVLEREAIFYDLEQKKILRLVDFRYNNVRNKMLDKSINQMAANKDHFNNINISEVTGIKNHNIMPHINQNYNKSNNQQIDKVNPISRRTEERPHSHSLKSRKNTNQTDQLKNAISGNVYINPNMKNSKVHSSVSGHSEVYDHMKRSITLMDYNLVQRRGQQASKSSNSKSQNRDPIQRQKQKLKKQVLKIRSSDTKNILKLITESKIQGSIQTIKAYQNSIQTFQKYVQIDKNKLEKEKQLFQEYKQPSGVAMKFDYKKSIHDMKNKSKELTIKRKQYMKTDKRIGHGLYGNAAQLQIFETQMSDRQKSSMGNRSRSSKPSKSSKTHTQTQPSHPEQAQPKNEQTPTSDYYQSSTSISDAFLTLQKKVLEIQSISFCDNYMLVSLMNCQLRLYSFKRTIHGFSEELLFQRSYQSMVTHVMIYRSLVRKMYNISVVMSKLSADYVAGNSNGSNTSNNVSTYTQKNQTMKLDLNINNISLQKKTLSDHINIRQTSLGIQKPKQTQILVYELSAQMQIERQAHMTSLTYSPIIVEMLPLGIGGYTESGYFYLLELNCTSKIKSEIKSIDTILYNPDSGKKVSISCMKCHRNLVSLYMGCKDGLIYVFDRLTGNVRFKNKISNHQILQIMFVSQGYQILFWDLSGKVGIINAENLNISNVVSIMNPINKNQIGESGGGQFMAMMEYSDNQFLVHGDRSIGLVSLYENPEKKFHVEKPIKIFNRRLTLKNRRSMAGTSQNFPQLYLSQKKLSQTEGSNIMTQPLQPSLKTIHTFFNVTDCLIIVTGQGQIIVYDQKGVYIGSYFTLNFKTLTKAISCQSIKYLYMLHQSNEMQVVNLYTQEQLISIANVKQQVYDIFFCHSSVYFCGYLSSKKKFELVIYGHPNQTYSSIKKGTSGYTQPLIVVSLYSVILGIDQQDDKTKATIKEKEKQKEKDKDKSNISNSKTQKLKRLNSVNVERSIIPTYQQLDIKFYKGSMIIINYQTSQILFLYKKSYTRNCIIRCQQQLQKYHSPPPQTASNQRIQQVYQPSHPHNPYIKPTQQPRICHSYIDNEAGKLSVLMSNCAILVVSLESKTVKLVYRLDLKNIGEVITQEVGYENDIANQNRFCNSGNINPKQRAPNTSNFNRQQLTPSQKNPQSQAQVQTQPQKSRNASNPAPPAPMPHQPALDALIRPIYTPVEHYYQHSEKRVSVTFDVDYYMLTNVQVDLMGDRYKDKDKDRKEANKSRGNTGNASNTNNNSNANINNTRDKDNLILSTNSLLNFSVSDLSVIKQQQQNFIYTYTLLSQQTLQPILSAGASNISFTPALHNRYKSKYKNRHLFAEYQLQQPAETDTQVQVVQKQMERGGEEYNIDDFMNGYRFEGAAPRGRQQMLGTQLLAVIKTEPNIYINDKNVTSDINTDKSTINQNLTSTLNPLKQRIRPPKNIITFIPPALPQGCVYSYKYRSLNQIEQPQPHKQQQNTKKHKAGLMQHQQPQQQGHNMYKQKNVVAPVQTQPYLQPYISTNSLPFQEFWSGSPYLLGDSIVTVSDDMMYFNLYRLHRETNHHKMMDYFSQVHKKAEKQPQDSQGFNYKRRQSVSPSKKQKLQHDQTANQSSNKLKNYKQVQIKVQHYKIQPQ